MGDRDDRAESPESQTLRKEGESFGPKLIAEESEPSYVDLAAVNGPEAPIPSFVGPGLVVAGRGREYALSGEHLRTPSARGAERVDPGGQEGFNGFHPLPFDCMELRDTPPSTFKNQVILAGSIIHFSLGRGDAKPLPLADSALTQSKLCKTFHDSGGTSKLFALLTSCPTIRCRAEATAPKLRYENRSGSSTHGNHGSTSRTRANRQWPSKKFSG